MRQLCFLMLTMALPVSTLATQSIDVAGQYSAVAYFTSGLDDGKPIDRIDTAYLDQDYVILYVNWDNVRTRAYRTEVRITDPNGDVVGRISNIVRPTNGGYYTYYYFRPGPGDTPGDWSYRMYIDGRSAFEAQIPILTAE